MQIARRREIVAVQGLLSRHPVVGIVGARQVGKTTLAREIAKLTNEQFALFDLENPQDLTRMSDPMLALKDLRGLVVIDEIQQVRDIFQVLRVLVDRPNSTTRFLVLGSASPGLLQQGSETLAGRIYYHELSGFAVDEVGVENLQRLWLRGGFPRSYLAATDEASHEWRRGFIRTFLERDLPQLGITIRAETLRRFWTMLAHYHGQVWNASEFGRAFGVSDTTARNYLDMLTSALVVRQLLPWHANITKRQVKAPKIYLADCGLVHSLLDLRTLEDVQSHPKVGASWEGLVIDQIIRRLAVEKEQCFFWRTHAGAEIDLFIKHRRERLGFEVKRTTNPKVTPSMRSAIDDLKLNQLHVIHAGDQTFPLADKIQAISAWRILEDIEPLT